MSYLTSIWQKTGGCLRRIESKELNNHLRVVKSDESLSSRLRFLIKQLKMAMNQTSSLHPSLLPPERVIGMTTLNRNDFKKTVSVPCIKLLRKEISKTQKNWRPLLLKLKGIKPIANLDDNDPCKETHNIVLLDPAKLDSDNAGNKEHLDRLERLGFSGEAIKNYEFEIGYENYSVTEVMKAVLPQESENVSSFTQIGHIAHLNLKEENLPYKNLIGEVIIDKISAVKTVVNKLNTIDNTYRNFQMELLAGENNFVTQTREHNCVFELDFSKVYWNSRLSTEHHRIVEIIPKGSVVYDIFAGVGPFTVPLAKKRDCIVFANDLNPHSYESLEKNIKLNKLKIDCVKAYNMDGRDFIRNVVKPDLEQKIKTTCIESVPEIGEGSLKDKSNKEEVTKNQPNKLFSNTFAVMNLPALAVEFLDEFKSLLSDLPVEFHHPEIIKQILPTVHCYAFCGKTEDMEGEVKRRAEGVLGQSLPSDAVVRNVRNVSPNKEMVCLSFKLWQELVLAEREQESDEPSSKRTKHS